MSANELRGSLALSGGRNRVGAKEILSPPLTVLLFVNPGEPFCLLKTPLSSDTGLPGIAGSFTNLCAGGFGAGGSFAQKCPFELDMLGWA